MTFLIVITARGDLADGTIATMGIPTFHAMGVGLHLHTCLAASQTVAVFTPRAPHPPTIPNTQNILELIKLTKCRVLPTFPAFLDVSLFLSSVRVPRWMTFPQGVESLSGGDRYPRKYGRCRKALSLNRFLATTEYFSTDVCRWSAIENHR